MINLFKIGFDFTLKSAQIYRTSYLPLLVNKNYINILDMFHQKPFCPMFDETTNINRMYIFNLFGAILDNIKLKPMLINTVQLTKTNSENILNELRFITGAIIVNRTDKCNFKYSITDGAPSV